MTTNVRIGPAGWSYADWEGTVYPSGSTERGRRFDALAYLSSYFSLIEINSTFYHVPSPHVCRSWSRRTPAAPGFTFTLKAHQSFTHSAEAPSSARIDEFKSAVAPLADAGKLHAVLLQFPWSFRDDRAARRRIERLASALAPLPVAVELRHGGWASQEARVYLESTGLSVCGIDQPVIGDSIRPQWFLTGSVGSYFRFHGRNYRNWFGDAGRDARYDYLYARDELASWLATIREAAGRGPVAVVMNNHFRGQAVANAFELMAMLSGGKVPAPRAVRRAYPRLADLTSPPPSPPGATGSLFEG